MMFLTHSRKVFSLGSKKRALLMMPRGLCSSSSSSSSKTVLVSKDPSTRVVTITLNDPKRLNALTATMGDEFVKVVEELQNDCEDVGAVVLTGSGKGFSAGGDLDFLRDRSKDTPSRNAVVMRRFYERFLSVRRIPVPVIAAIQGPAIGAGLCVALACDLRVAYAEAKLGVTFTGLGLHPGMGSSYFLPKLIGPQQSSKMLLTGEVISGTKAKEIGLVAEALESPEATVEEATKIAAKMAAAGPVAVRTCVRSLRMAQDEGLDKALWREADAQAQTYASIDLAEGVEAVAEKRRPVFQQWESLKD